MKTMLKKCVSAALGGANAMRELSAAAKSLREVKEAYRNFLVLWALDRLAASPEAMNRVAADMQRQSEEALANPYDHNWSLLYRGNVLDD